MSKLHDLTVDLGIEVDKFTSKIEEEKRRILETKARFERQLKDRIESEAKKTLLASHLDDLMKTCFVDCPTSHQDVEEKTKRCLQYLTKALGEVRVAAERIRDERMEVLSKYKAKIDKCDSIFNKNQMLESFLETWRRNIREGKELTEVPEVIKKISEEIASYYEIPPHKIIEDSMEASKALVSCVGDVVLENSITHSHASLPTVVPAMSDASSMVMETPVIHSNPKNYAHPQESLESVDFSRIVDFDNTLINTINEDLYSDKALKEMINTAAVSSPQNAGDVTECRMDEDITLL